jgi:hypothetical protein
MRTLEFTAEDGEKIKIFHPEDILAIKKPSKAIPPQRGINTIIYFRNTDNMMCVREPYSSVSRSVSIAKRNVENDLISALNGATGHNLCQ